MEKRVVSTIPVWLPGRPTTSDCGATMLPAGARGVIQSSV